MVGFEKTLYVKSAAYVTKTAHFFSTVSSLSTVHFSWSNLPLLLASGLHFNFFLKCWKWHCTPQNSTNKKICHWKKKQFLAKWLALGFTYVRYGSHSMRAQHPKVKRRTVLLPLFAWNYVSAWPQRTHACVRSTTRDVQSLQSLQRHTHISGECERNVLLLSFVI